MGAILSGTQSVTSRRFSNTTPVTGLQCLLPASLLEASGPRSFDGLL